MNDPFEILCAYDPVDQSEIDAYVQIHAAEVKQRILASPRLLPPTGDVITVPGPVISPRRWPRIAAVAASVAVLAAAAFVVTRSAETTEVVTCYEGLSLESDRVGIQPEGRDPAACAEVWQSGTLVNDLVAQPFSVPPLSACVDDAGAIAVFPTADAAICADLGLALLDLEAPLPGAGEIVVVQDALREFIGLQGCVPADILAAEARTRLDAAGLTDWSVEAPAEQTTGTCAFFGIDDRTKTIVITPTPDS